MAFRLGKKIAKWTAILTILDYLMFIITALFSIMIVANLQPENYGLFSLAAAIYPLISSMLQSFIVYPVIRIASINYEKGELTLLSSILSFSIFIIIIFSSFLFLLNMILSEFIAREIFHLPQLALYIELLSINIITMSLLGLLRGLFLSINSYTKLAISRFFDGIFYVGGIYLIVFFYGWSIYSVSMGTNIYLFLSMISSLILLFSDLKRLNIKFTLQAWRHQLTEIIKLGKYFIISGNIYYLFLRLDLLMIPQFISNPVLIGYYAFAKNILYRVRVLFTRINALLYPTFSGKSSIESMKTIVKLLKAGILISFIITFPVAILASSFAKSILIILSILIPKLYSYLEAWILISIFSFIIIPYALNANIVAFFNGIGEVDKQVYANIILIITYVSLMPPFTIVYGIVGAATSYILAHIVRTSYWLIETNKKVKLNIRKYAGVLITNLISFLIIYLIYFVASNLLYGLLAQIYLGEIIFLIPLIILYFFLDFLLLLKLCVISQYEYHVLKKLFRKYGIILKFLLKIEKIFNICD